MGKNMNQTDESAMPTEEPFSTAQNTWGPVSSTGSSWQRQPGFGSTDTVNQFIPPSRNPFAQTSQGFAQSSTAPRIAERDPQNLMYSAPMSELNKRSSVAPETGQQRFVGAIGWNYKGRGPPQVRPQETPQRGSTWTAEKSEQMMKSLAPLVGLDASSSSGLSLPAVANASKSKEPDGAMRSTLSVLPSISSGSPAKPQKDAGKASGAGREGGVPLPPLDLSGTNKGGLHDRRGSGKTGRTRPAPKTVR
jgi:hypothetical protein